MNQTVHGRTRNPGIVIILSVVTIGVYWFVWMYKAPKELGDATDRRMGSALWVPTLALIWAGYVVGVVVLLVLVMNRLSELVGPSGAPTFDLAVQAAEEYLVFRIVLAAVIIVFSVLQGIYLWRVSVAAREVALQTQAAQQPKPLFAALFNGGWALGEVPLIGLLFAIAAIVLAIIWIVQIQQFLNGYWTRDAGYMPAAHAAATPQGWVPRDEPPAQEAAVGAFRPDPAARQPPKTQDMPTPKPGGPPAVPQEKRFACPDCSTQIRVNYVPGQRTPVQCPNCGTRGVVR